MSRLCHDCVTNTQHIIADVKCTPQQEVEACWVRIGVLVWYFTMRGLGERGLASLCKVARESKKRGALARTHEDGRAFCGAGWVFCGAGWCSLRVLTRVASGWGSQRGDDGAR